MNKKIITFITFLSFLGYLNGQKIEDLSTCLHVVRDYSFRSLMAEQNLERSSEILRFARSAWMPQVSLQANLPNYTRTSRGIIQPNGSLSFLPVYQNNSFLGIQVQQALPWTGGTLFVETGLERFDDFSQSNKIYNGVPFRIGYQQSLLGFNAIKWEQKIENLRYQLAKRQWETEIAQIEAEAVDLYFQVLLAEINVAIADSNLVINRKLLTIAEERWDLGKISEDEKLQMEAEYKASQMMYALAQNRLEISQVALKNLISSNIILAASLPIPEHNSLTLPTESALRAYLSTQAPAILENRFNRELARQTEARQKAEFGPIFEISASLGVAKSGDAVSDIYTAPFIEQQVNVGVRMPLLDWGRKKSVTQQNKINLKINDLLYDQSKMNIENHITLVFRRFEELKQRLRMQEELLDIAQKRYFISTERYASGQILLTEWVLAQRNKDQTKRDLVISTMEYFQLYYQLRSLAPSLF